MKRWLAFAMVVPLAACNPFASNDGPSEKDIADALGRSGAKVQSTERIACKTAPDRPGYVCDYRATTCSPFTGKCDKSATRTGRFVRYGDNWMFRDDVADPNRYATPAPAPTQSPAVTELSPTPTPTPVASPTPSPTPSPSPSPKPSSSPTSKATPTPKASPTPKSSPTPTPTTAPTPKATAKPTPKPMPGGVNRTWLSGRWGAENGDCTARHAVNFGPGGGFYGKRGMGHWSLDGKTVKVTGNYSADDKPFDQILKVDRIGDDAMVMEGKRYHRCPN